MFGTFRLFLALCVVALHMGVHVGDIYPGVSAVICFLMISGYAMSGLVESAYPSLSRAPAFYLDRAARLMPQYWAFILLSAVTVYGFGSRTLPIQDAPISLLGMITNLVPPPVGVKISPDTLGHALLIPQGWTIGLEIIFYVALPFMRKFRWLAVALLVLGAVVFYRATHNQMNPDLYGYRLMPSPLLWFMAGVAWHRKDFLTYLAVLAFALFDFVSITMSGQLSLSYNASVLFGAAVGLVMIPALAALPRNRIDDMLGNASYGTYLSHQILVNLFEAHKGEWEYVIAAMAGSVGLGYAGYFLVEARVTAWRKARRANIRVRDLLPATL